MSKQKGIASINILVIIVLVALVVVGAAAVKMRHKSPASSKTSVAAPGWMNYSSKTYGFEFNYPTSWGTPKVQLTNGKAGKHYDINFGLTTTISMDSKDYSQCNTQNCPDGQALTAGSITDKLKATDKSIFTAYTDNSFAILTNTGQNTQHLAIVQAISLPKENISAAQLSYSSRTDSASCPDKAFSNPPCISKNNYDDAVKTLSSFKDL